MTMSHGVACSYYLLLLLLLVATFGTAPIIQEKALYVKFLTSCVGGEKGNEINIVSFVP